LQLVSTLHAGVRGEHRLHTGPPLATRRTAIRDVESQIIRRDRVTYPGVFVPMT